MSAGAGAAASLGGAVREHADIDATKQVQAIQLLCAEIATEPDSSRRDDLGRDGYRRVLGLVQQLEQANTGVRSSLEAAADRSAAAQRGVQVVGVWLAARTLEMAVTIGTAVFGAFATGIAELESKLRPRAARALNTAHLRELVARSVGARTAAKQFLSTVLLQIPAPVSVATAGVAVQSAGAMGQGLFATTGLPPGTVVGEYRGEVLDAVAFDARYPARTDCDYVRMIIEACFCRVTVHIHDGGRRVLTRNARTCCPVFAIWLERSGDASCRRRVGRRSLDRPVINQPHAIPQPCRGCSLQLRRLRYEYHPSAWFRLHACPEFISLRVTGMDCVLQSETRTMSARCQRRSSSRFVKLALENSSFSTTGRSTGRGVEQVHRRQKRLRRWQARLRRRRT
jgi:hypothetical protein